MKRYILILLMIFLFSPLWKASGEVKVKIKNIAYFEGLKDNQVFGFGLVVGLQGTGDTKSALARSSIMNLLKNLGLDAGEDFNSKNIAAVLLTAKLPPFVRIGDRVDVTISSIGDAKSLDGGILIQSPLKGADDNIYVVAQGPLPRDNETGRRSAKTVAYISNGGIVERAIEPEFITKNTISLILKNWDFSVAGQVIKAISSKYQDIKPEIIKGGKIRINIPKESDIVSFISTIENIEITPEYSAKIVINEKDGTIVMGGDVKISEVLVSKDGIMVKVKDREEKSNIAHLKETSTVKDLVDALTYIGVSTRDIISIMKALKDAGALHAELIVK